MSITLPPAPDWTGELFASDAPAAGMFVRAEEVFGFATSYATAAVESDRASQPQTVPVELRAAAAAVIARWGSPAWKEAEHTGVSINRLHAALEAVEAAPVALTQPAEPQDVPSDLIIEVAEAMQVRRILEQIKQVAATWPLSDKPLAFASGWSLCCEEIFYRATGEKWHMDEDEAHFSATNRLKRLTSAAANEAPAGVAQAQPESAPPAKASLTVAQFDEMRAYGQQCADAALEEAALLVEGRRDLARQEFARERILDAAAEGDEDDELARLRHESDVSLFNAALTRAAAAIRALADAPAVQPESAPARVPMTPDEAGQLWRAVHAARSAGGDHHETSYVAFARAVEQRCGIGSTT